MTRKVRANFGILSQSTLPIVTTLKKLGIVQPITVDIGGILKSLLFLPKTCALFMKKKNDSYFLIFITFAIFL